jgi:hypothetical protein
MIDRIYGENVLRHYSSISPYREGFIGPSQLALRGAHSRAIAVGAFLFSSHWADTFAHTYGNLGSTSEIALLSTASSEPEYGMTAYRTDTDAESLLEVGGVSVHR